MTAMNAKCQLVFFISNYLYASIFPLIRNLSNFSSLIDMGRGSAPGLIAPSGGHYRSISAVGELSPLFSLILSSTFTFSPNSLIIRFMVGKSQLASGYISLNLSLY